METFNTLKPRLRFLILKLDYLKKKALYSFQKLKLVLVCGHKKWCSKPMFWNKSHADECYEAFALGGKVVIPLIVLIFCFSFCLLFSSL
jgi:hypothetical protein